MEIFPSSIQLNGFFIESSSLINESELILEENLCINQALCTFENLKLRKILSDYKTKHLYSISPNNLGNYKKLTNICHIENIDLNNLNRNSIIDEGTKLDICIDFIEFGRLDAFVYGYEFSDKNKMFLYSQFKDDDFKSLTDNFGAILFCERILIDRKAKLNFSFMSKNGFFSLYFNNLS